MTDRDALAREMQEALRLRANPIFDTCAEIALHHIAAARAEALEAAARVCEEDLEPELYYLAANIRALMETPT